MLEQITCGECVLKSPDGQVCQKFNIEIKDPGASCPEGVKELAICDLCGKPFVMKHGIIDMGLNHKTHFICNQCNQRYYTCQTCGQASTCDFQTSSIDLPKQIQQKIQAGNGYIVTNIANPARIEKTCKAGCKCYSEEFGCFKQTNYCNNYHIIWKT